MTQRVSALGLDATIGILGGGQLGRMLALAAARLGLKCHVYAPEPQSPAFEVVRSVTQADYADENALDRFSRDVDVITYEFENVPHETAAFLAARKPVLPDPSVLAVTQDRLIEKDFVTNLGIPTAPYLKVDRFDELAAMVGKIGKPAVLKTRRFGYDGKGQVMIRNGVDLASAWAAMGEQPSILETFVNFEREISVVAARSHDGHVECFDVTENEHRDHILKVSHVPASIPPSVAAQARRIAETFANAVNYVGVFAVEMFVVASGQPGGEPHIL
ncbi:MAG TPA: ATP-grasp domain-containing protein, partial [Xanthobacteraceae bacterium]|nr:ATP-grasp domain-containing protein [Xanthobacteraceae bacterium]